MIACLLQLPKCVEQNEGSPLFVRFVKKLCIFSILWNEKSFMCFLLNVAGKWL